MRTEKDIGAKTPKPQRFRGFLLPFFKVKFRRYHSTKTTFGEDLN